MSPLETATSEELVRELIARHQYLVMGGTLKMGSADPNTERVTLIVHGSTHGCAGAVQMIGMAVSRVMAGHLERMRPPGGDDADLQG